MKMQLVWEELWAMAYISPLYDKFGIARDKIKKPLAIDDMPEVLIVPLNWMGIKFIVGGLRIKLFNNDYLKRKKQLENVMDLIGKQFSDYKYYIIGGDFNNNKSDYKNCQWRDQWSLGVIDSIAVSYTHLGVT